MAVVPISGTKIRLLSGVPFQSDYKHTRWFDTLAEQTSYFTNKPIVHQINEANFQRENGNTYISVNNSVDDLRTVNYLMFQNSQYESKWFYAFVTKLEYVRKEMTKVHFRLDVFQTWKFQMNIQPSFVVREHCRLWNADGTPVVNTVDEGLSYGNEYTTTGFEQYKPSGGLMFLVIVTKSLLHNNPANKQVENEIYPNLNGVPQPLCFYIHPFLMDGSVPRNDGLLTPILDTLKGIYKNKTAVNNVVALYVTDYIGIDFDYSAGKELSFEDEIFQKVSISDNETGNINTIFIKKLPAYHTKMKEVQSDKYSGMTKPKESKLLMYPYAMTILDDYRGNRQVYKNEYIDEKGITLSIRGAIGTSNRVSYGIPKYNTANGMDDSDRSKTSNETALINMNANDVPIISDYLSAYLQGNRNAIENQKAQINFAGTMSVLNAGSQGVQAGLQGNVGGVVDAGLNAVQGAGNNVLQLQAIEAKQMDINNVPPSLSKMGSNTYYDYGNGYDGVFILKKQIKPEYRTKLQDFFNMYGYKLNEVKVPNFHTRKYWNYVQTNGIVIRGNFNNEDLNEIKSIFDGGITFWHTDDIGNYNLDNEVL